MSSRLARTLLKLYPRWVRDRYGEELLALEDELSAHGERSRTRLIRDMLAGALVVRPTRHRVRLIIGAVCLATAVAGAALIIASRTMTGSARRSHSAAIASLNRNRHAPTTIGPIQPGGTCFVAADSSCSATPCSQFAGPTSTQDAADIRNASGTQRGRRVIAERCAAHPQILPQPPVFVRRG
jgi:hypothetical protein